ncbi:amidase family protein [Breoghania sp.]|uniref:amidase family protein n=1 Tax=Breoghania sp. TaxID=2065378 RepID=UPI002601A57D|nr:amidase family protein [Breoghania sp.]MDJ0930915.1 amidase family protein [Breoghania sp.]
MTKQNDAMALAAAIASSRVSASEAMEASLAAVRKHRDLGAVDVLKPELGLEVAAAFDAERRTTPESLSGRPFGDVPTLVKDLGSPFAGIPEAAGSNALRGLSDGSADSEFARRFRATGLISFGSTLVPEFGMSVSTEPLGRDPARNPLDPKRTPGGSSGGSVACCGLIGLKPSRGVMPQAPDFGNIWPGSPRNLPCAVPSGTHASPSIT